MKREALIGLLDRLWDDHEPGLIWDGKPDESLDRGDGEIVEIWHTPAGTVRSWHHIDGDEHLVEVTGP